LAKRELRVLYCIIDGVRGCLISKRGGLQALD
jgi:hypothetical protein